MSLRHAGFGVALALGLSSCSEPSGPALSVTGTWIGDYRSAQDPTWIVQSTFTLTQRGTNVSGTLTTTAGRAGNFTGTFTGTRLTGSLTFVDECTGSATTTAEIKFNATWLSGEYHTTDCRGLTSGTYDLLRR